MNGSGSEFRLVREYPRVWAEMDPDVLGLIFIRLSLEKKLEVIPRVCKPWRHAVEGPYSWKNMEKIDIHGLITRDKCKKLDRKLRMLVTTSFAVSSSSIDHPGFDNGKEYRAWAEMDSEALRLIFNELSFEEKLQVIPRVCKPWRKVVDGSNYSPEYQHRIDIDEWRTRDSHKKQFQISLNEHSKQFSLMLLRVLVTRNSGGFHELYVSWIGDPQLSFIARHARSLQVLSVKASSITDSMVEQVAPELASLTAIDLSHCKDITARSIEAIGTNCGSLESFTWDMRKIRCVRCGYIDAPRKEEMGWAIIRTMHKLKRLSLAHVNIGFEVADSILSDCPALEWFSIRGCWRVFLESRNVLMNKYPKIKVVHPLSYGPGDNDDEWGIINCRGRHLPRR